VKYMTTFAHAKRVIVENLVSTSLTTEFVIGRHTVDFLKVLAC